MIRHFYVIPTFMTKNKTETEIKKKLNGKMKEIHQWKIYDIKINLITCVFFSLFLGSNSIMIWARVFKTKTPKTEVMTKQKGIDLKLHKMFVHKICQPLHLVK